MQISSSQDLYEASIIVARFFRIFPRRLSTCAGAEDIAGVRSTTICNALLEKLDIEQNKWTPCKCTWEKQDVQICNI